MGSWQVDIQACKELQHCYFLAFAGFMELKALLIPKPSSVAVQNHGEVLVIASGSIVVRTISACHMTHRPAWSRS